MSFMLSSHSKIFMMVFSDFFRPTNLRMPRLALKIILRDAPVVCGGY